MLDTASASSIIAEIQLDIIPTNLNLVKLIIYERVIRCGSRNAEVYGYL